MRYQVETDATGKWSLTPGVWLTRGVPPNRVSAQAISSEVVVWADYDRDARPIGHHVGAAPVDGVEYEAGDLVASVEFGSELQSGSGVTWIRSFDVAGERR